MTSSFDVDGAIDSAPVAGLSARLAFFFAIALARRSCNLSFDAETLLLLLERSDETIKLVSS